ncbi:MAG: MFS transporter [Gammaproteobacteria bacterium]|nr:MFS transporter [Gammaproteobacteria bacterium]NIR58730.1 MFS transporter [Gammaproteobacteria bacterium]NIR88584.1 MFS transporter [Gammaproteobacteria bacterium]
MAVTASDAAHTTIAPPTTGAHSLLSLMGSCWSLLLGMALLAMGNGLQGPLLGLRAVLEGFSTPVTGVVMSCYFLGLVAGSLLTPPLLSRVGHVRVFAALAALASAAVLWAAVLVDPINWAAVRLVIGFCYAGLYVVAESWLNDRSSNAVRGQLLAVYVVIMLIGMGVGPLFLNVADPAGFILFMLVSVLVSVAVLPMLLTAGPAPRFDIAEKMSLPRLYREAPLGVVGCAVTGLSNGAFIGMGVVYAQLEGFSVAQSSLFITAAIWGGVCLQWPIGYLSDSYERRWVLAAVTCAAGLCAVGAVPVANVSVWAVIALAALFGGLSFPGYSLSLAHANDRLAPSQMVAASSALVLVTALGAVLGPFMVGVLISFVSPSMFFWFLAAFHLALAVFAVYRIGRRPGVEAHSRPVYLSRTSAIATAAALESAREHANEGSPASVVGGEALDPTQEGANA